MIIDWDGDGEIDDLDIALSVSLQAYEEDEGDNSGPATGVSQNPGCLHTTLIIISAITGAVAFLAGWF